MICAVPGSQAHLHTQTHIAVLIMVSFFLLTDHTVCCSERCMTLVHEGAVEHCSKRFVAGQRQGFNSVISHAAFPILHELRHGGKFG